MFVAHIATEAFRRDIEALTETRVNSAPLVPPERQSLLLSAPPIGRISITARVIGITPVQSAGPLAITVIDVWPDTDPTAARMMTVPELAPVTTPAALTVAMAGFAELQVTALPVRVAPFASRTSAVSVTVSPSERMFVGATTETD
jgi:hypothetical protein